MRNAVVRFLHQVTGPCVSLASLRCLYPAIPPCVLADLLGRYRRVWKRRYARHGYRITWHKPGRVWAIDHSEAAYPVDGVYRYLIAVRDLASHRQLAWHPCTSTQVREVLPLMRDLFARHGAPLILKSDNGSAFVADAMGNLVQESEVAQLFSPPRRPQFNGALERSNGLLKVYTQQHAIREGHPFRWSSDDLEHARQLANTLARPWGHQKPSPQEAWDRRDPITGDERRRFKDALQSHRAGAREDLGLDAAKELSAFDKARLDRIAIARTAEQLEYLSIRRIRRAEKPKRVSKHEMLRRAGDADNDDQPRGSPPPKSRPARTEPKNKMLASKNQNGKMQQASRKKLSNRQHSDTTSAHRERTFTSCKQRLITLLLYFRNAAIFKH